MADKQQAPAAGEQKAPGKASKSGHRPGKGAPQAPRDGGARPVEEEDTFGGAERAAKGEPVRSPNAKP